MDTINFEAHRQRLLREKRGISGCLDEHNGAFQYSVKADPCNHVDTAWDEPAANIQDHRISAIEDRFLDAVDEALRRLMNG